MSKPGQKPSLGRIVHYRSKTGNYTLAAIVTATHESQWAPGVDRGDVPALDPELGEVCLHVFTPGAQESYQELAVPYDADGGPRSWKWPDRV